MKNGAYVINLDEYKSKGIRCIVLHVNDNVTYFHSFGAEYIPKEIKPFIGNNNVTKNT